MEAKKSITDIQNEICERVEKILKENGFKTTYGQTLNSLDAVLWAKKDEDIIQVVCGIEFDDDEVKEISENVFGGDE